MRYVANVEDDSLLYNVFAGIIVSMAIVSGVAMVIGQVIIGKFVKRIEQDRLAKEQMSRAMYHGIATPIIDLRDQVDMFRLGYFPESLPALAHPERINTIVENLVGNAVKYTPKGGRVAVSLRVVKPGLVRRLARRVARRSTRTGVVLTVADTGIGISPHDQARMFDEFYRGEEAKKMEAGDGEGLALVHAIAVPFYGGEIKCKSKVGAGTEFTVTRPLRVL